MAERKTYPGGLVKAFGVPNISFPQYAEQARGMTNLVQKINSVNTFALGQLTEVAKEEGYKYASDNQISLNQYLNADAIERNKLVEGDKVTVAGKTIRAAQINFLASEIEIAASSAFTSLKIQAVSNDWEMGEYKMALDAIVDGYSDALMDADAEAALTAKAKLATTAHSYLSSYSDRALKKSLAVQSNNAMAFSYREIGKISDIIISGSKALPVPPGEKPIFIDLDEVLEIRKRAIINTLNPHMTSGEVSKFITAWDNEVIKAKKDVLFDWLDQPRNRVTAAATQNAWVEVNNETFSGDIGMQNIFKSLDPVDQKTFKEKVRTWKGKVFEDFEKEDDAFELDLNDQIEDWEFKFAQAKINNDYDTAENIVQKIFALAAEDNNYKSLAVTYQKALEADAKSGEYLDHDALVDLKEDLINGTLTMDEIRDAYDDYKIGSKEWDDLAFKLVTKKRTVFKDAEKLIKTAVGYPDHSVFQMRAADKVAFQRYTIATNALLNWMYENPEAAPNDVLTEAGNLIAVHSKEASQDVLKAQSIKTLVSYDGFWLNSKPWRNHLKTYLEEGEEYEAMSIQLSTLEGTELLRSRIEYLFQWELSKRPLEISDEKIRLLLEELDILIEIHNG